MFSTLLIQGLFLYFTGVTSIPVLESDVKSGNLVDVTGRAKVVMNCTGPNTVLSEPIVKACIETGTHYVDISAELYVSKNINTRYNNGV